MAELNKVIAHEFNPYLSIFNRLNEVINGKMQFY